MSPSTDTAHSYWPSATRHASCPTTPAFITSLVAGATAVPIPRLNRHCSPTNKGVSSTKPATTISSRPAPLGSAAKVTTAKIAAQGSEDTESSFDVLFDVDDDTLEETMKAYD